MSCLLLCCVLFFFPKTFNIFQLHAQAVKSPIPSHILSQLILTYGHGQCGKIISKPHTTGLPWHYKISIKKIHFLKDIYEKDYIFK